MFDVQFSFKEIQRNAAQKRAVEIARRLLENRVPIEIISESTGLDIEFIEQIGLRDEIAALPV